MKLFFNTRSKTGFLSGYARNMTLRKSLFSAEASSVLHPLPPLFSPPHTPRGSPCREEKRIKIISKVRLLIC